MNVELKSATFDTEIFFEGETRYVRCTTFDKGEPVWGVTPYNKRLHTLLEKAKINISVNVRFPDELKGWVAEPPGSVASAAKRRKKTTAG